ncbi:MAG: VOC family protein [Anaerolineae bacterium]|nr:VOC family protein [Anaerolineae bacterium]
MANEITIPILPCRSIDDTLAFYRVLGFEVTYQQAKPNIYACVKYEDIQLHFFILKGYDPTQSYSTCYISVPDTEALYRAFATGIRQHYGKLLVAGIPRMTPIRKRTEGELRFNVIDPGGNWIRIGQQVATTTDSETDARQLSPLARATRAADFLAESKADYEAAAKMLDTALAKVTPDEPATTIELIQALSIRSGVALHLSDSAFARAKLIEIRQLELTSEDRAVLTVELERASDLEAMLP